jgi:hypothetical protein
MLSVSGQLRETQWNPCHSLIFDYLSISIEEKMANLGYPEKPLV